MEGIFEMYLSIKSYNEAAAERYLLLINHPYYTRSQRRKWQRVPDQVWVRARQG